MLLFVAAPAFAQLRVVSLFKGPAGTTTTQNPDTTSITDGGPLSYIVYYGSYAGSNLAYGADSNGNDVVVEFSSVPEPGVTLLIASAAMLLRRHRHCR